MLEASPAATAAATLELKEEAFMRPFATLDAVESGEQAGQLHEHSYVLHAGQSHEPQSQAGSAKSSARLSIFPKKKSVR
jgi:hypothetical protein